LRKFLSLFKRESGISDSLLNKEDIFHEEEFLESVIDEKFLIDEYEIREILVRGLLSVLFLFYEREMFTMIESFDMLMKEGDFTVLRIYLFGKVKFVDLLVFLILCDIATGIMKAFKNKCLRSHTALYGYFRIHGIDCC
jgi:hypothetical protein